MFLSCLDFSIKKSIYTNINLKPKQVICLEAIFKRRDTVAVLPTGYGKSLIYQLLPSLLSKRNEFEQKQSDQMSSTRSFSVVLVVSPLNSLIEDQLRKINECTELTAAVLKVKREECVNSDLSLSENHSTGLKDALYDIVFLHPEACLSSKEGLLLLQSEPYQTSVEAIVVDEAHCILEW